MPFIVYPSQLLCWRVLKVGFAAVNCWYTKGSCRQTYKVVQFPVLVLHQNTMSEITYNGRHCSCFYEVFLRAHHVQHLKMPTLHTHSSAAPC